MYKYIQEKNMFELIQELNRINNNMILCNQTLEVISIVKDKDWFYAVCKKIELNR